MSLISSFLKLLSIRQGCRRMPLYGCIATKIKRKYSDTPTTDVNSKQIVVQGSENEERVRVRRARPADVPRVLRFVRDHARCVWPSLVAAPSGSHLVLCDYVARALAQGHSMLAEQQEARRGWSQIRGIAIGMSVCPWDASMLEKWARCVRCSRSRRLMHFTAHCLRAPALHDKYRVHNILQMYTGFLSMFSFTVKFVVYLNTALKTTYLREVILIVPPESPKSTEIIHILAKNAIQRGRDVGFPLLRFDVTDDSMAKSLEEIKMKKEWQIAYDVLPETLKEGNVGGGRGTEAKTEKEAPKGTPAEGPFLSVYTAFTQPEKRKTFESVDNK